MTKSELLQYGMGEFHAVVQSRLGRLSIRWKSFGLCATAVLRMSGATRRISTPLREWRIVKDETIGLRGDGRKGEWCAV